jgi:membrane associated rhomboid family serine protease
MGLYDRDYYHEQEFQPVMRWDSRSIVSLLIIINVVVFVANFLSGSANPVNKLLCLASPDHLKQPWQWYRLLTNGFVHASLPHIFLNLLSLFFLGPTVEAKYGRGEFLRIFLIAILGCSLIWLLRHSLSGSKPMFLVGASGAITAVTMLFVLNFPHSTLSLWGVVPVKAWVVGVMLIVFNLLGNSSIQFNGVKNVAYDVHLLGAAFAAIYFYGKLNFESLGSLGASIGKLFKGKPNLKIHQPEDGQAESGIDPNMQAEADRILEKIHREGQDSLSAKERKLLEKYSRAVREQRQK